jgi:hypothetical protein
MVVVTFAKHNLFSRPSVVVAVHVLVSLTRSISFASAGVRCRRFPMTNG